MKTKKRLSHLDPNYHTGHPVRPEDLNQDRLKALEEARIAHLPEYIAHLEKRLISLAKQKEKAERLLAKAKQELAQREEAQ